MIKENPHYLMWKVAEEFFWCSCGSCKYTMVNSQNQNLEFKNHITDVLFLPKIDHGSYPQIGGLKLIQTFTYDFQG